MFFFCPTAPQNVAESASWNLTSPVNDRAVQEQSFSMLNGSMQEIRIGRTYYRFVRRVIVNYAPTSKGWMCYVSTLTGYLGNGDTPEQAFEELTVQMHTDFQTLLTKRPFEMDDKEHSKWVELTRIIDLFYYRTTTPITTYEIGQVSFGKIARPHHITWISGEKTFIEPNKVPGELMSCRPGQWIDAGVRREPLSYRVLEIESIRRIRFHKPSESELTSAWENMPEAHLESAEWVW